MPVRAGIAVDRRPDPSGNPRQRLQALETALIGEIHQVLQHRARRRRHAFPGAVNVSSANRTTRPRKPSSETIRLVPPPVTITGVPSLARRRDRGHEGRFVAGLREQVGLDRRCRIGYNGRVECGWKR